MHPVSVCFRSIQGNKTTVVKQHELFNILAKDLKRLGGIEVSLFKFDLSSAVTDGNIVGNVLGVDESHIITEALKIALWKQRSTFLRIARTIRVQSTVHWQEFFEHICQNPWSKSGKVKTREVWEKALFCFSTSNLWYETQAFSKRFETGEGAIERSSERKMHDEAGRWLQGFKKLR